MPPYFWNLLVALDQLLNSIFGGYPDETISLRAALARNDGKQWGCVACKILESIVPDHCNNVINSERNERRV